MKLTIYKKICSILLALALLLWPPAPAAWTAAGSPLLPKQTSLAQAANLPQLLNDRTADIIGSAPLLAPGLLTASGLSGKGQIIGLADSGLDRGSLSDIHPDLQSEEGQMPRVAMLRSYAGRYLPDDPIGHGTHMAATMVGSGQASEGKYRGIAPGASLYFQALLDNNGSLTLPLNLQDLFMPAYSAGVRLHINGWGSGSNVYAGNSAAIDDFVFHYPDFLPVFGAGNNGPAASSLSSEANSKNALTVGSSQVPRPAFSPEALDAELIADSSSRGPAAGGRIKPDLLAPGSALISACSRLIDSNYAANSQYSLMGGSSMAAAVAGGALALLSEYLESQRQLPRPSSSLLKALLINGSRTPAGFPSPELGFGILDLAGTILALQEGNFAFQEESLLREELREYKLEIRNSRAPFKATLAWVDSPGRSGTDTAGILQNDLDLLVLAPGGKIYYGNDFSRRGEADRVNNVEQVIITDPLPGEYTIRVIGAKEENSTFSQPFSLVYGQALQHEIVVAKSGSELRLESGSSIDLDSFKLSSVLDGLLSGEELAAGSDFYLGQTSAYSFSRNWGSGGVQMLPWRDSGRLLLEVNTKLREGGYLVDTQADANNEAFYVNDTLLSEWESLPTGVGIRAVINPSRQTLWQFSAKYSKARGFIESFDFEQGELKLFHDSEIYPLAPFTVVSFDDELVDCSHLAAAFGSGESGSLEKLAPGMKVELLTAPETGEIQYIWVERRIIMGDISALDMIDGQLTLDSGKSYGLFPGTQVFKDKEPASLDEITAGDRIEALLLADSEQIIQLNALSRIEYGQLAHFNRKTGDLYYFDSEKQFAMEKIDDSSEVYRDGIEVGAGALQPGCWLRLIKSPDGEKLWRLDIAREQAEMEKVLVHYSAAENSLLMNDGSTYYLNPLTRISKGAYVIEADLLLAGERIKLTTIVGTAPGAEALMQAEVLEGFDGPPPELTANAYNLNGVLIIKGFSSAERILLYRSEGTEEIALSADGSFSRVFLLAEEEKELRLLAMDSRTQGIKAIDIIIEAYPLPEDSPQFKDISGHPAQKDIEEMAGQGFIRGYPDGSFRPERPINRADFISLLARSQGWSLEGEESPRYFTDNGQIPWWAIEAVYAGQKKGLIKGYPDGSLGPWQELSRSEAVLLLSLLLPEPLSPAAEEEGSPNPAAAELPYSDRHSVPAWAYPGFLRLYDAGLLPYPAGEELLPEQALTRGEAVMMVVGVRNEE